MNIPQQKVRKMKIITGSIAVVLIFTSLIYAIVIKDQRKLKSFNNSRASLSENSNFNSVSESKSGLNEEKTNLFADDKPLNWPWRGINVVLGQKNDDIDSADIAQLKDKGVNFIRLRLSVRKYAESYHTSVGNSKIRSFSLADKLIRWCRKEGIVVLISHSDFPLDPKLKISKNDNLFWDNHELLDESILFVEEVVRYFDHWDNVVGYEFFAEPAYEYGLGKVKTPDIWPAHFAKILKQIRVISKKYVCYSTGPGGSPIRYKSMKDPIQDNRIIYNFHFYHPYKYTMQGTEKNKEKYKYPGKILTEYWDRNTIGDEINIPVEWCRRNNKLLYAGEFGAVVYAEDRANYLGDVLSVLEEKKISYSYTAYNGWPGWRADYIFDESKKKLIKSKVKTKTEFVLENYWALNKN